MKILAILLLTAALIGLAFFFKNKRAPVISSPVLAASPTLKDFADAIAEFEGYNKPGSLARRNRNPGNLKWAGQPGVIGIDKHGHAIFKTHELGRLALV